MQGSALTTLFLIAAIGAPGVAGCKKKEKPALPPMETTQEGSPPASGDDKGVVPDASKPSSAFVPVTVEEVKPNIPTLTGAAPLGEPTVVAGGRRVNALQCASGVEPAKVRAELEAKLAGLGFQVVETRRPRRGVDALIVQKGDLRISASVRISKDLDCPATENKSKVYLTYLKVPNPARPDKRPGRIPVWGSGRQPPPIQNPGPGIRVPGSEEGASTEPSASAPKTPG